MNVKPPEPAIYLRPEEFRYLLLPSLNPPAEYLAAHATIFSLWRTIWTEVFVGLNIDPAVLEDEFGRQDLICAIMHGEEPVAVHLYTFFAADCLAARAHTYLKQYPELFFERIAEKGLRKLMSMEYMAVNPAWRKGRSPVHMGAVLVGLAAEVTKLYQQDAAIAPARRDHKVNEIAFAFGGEAVLSNVINHNVPCDLLACRRENLVPHADPRIRGMVDSLWRRQENASGLAMPARTPLRIAA